MDQKIVNKILNETEQGYNFMSDKFSQTRKFFWRGLEPIADYVKDGDKVLDFGCGNGRLLELFSSKDIDYSGLDVSDKLIGLAREKYENIYPAASPQGGVAEGEFNRVKFRKISGSESLAFPENSFNRAFSIAVFHHLPGNELRFMIAEELYRILKKDGIVVITVWNLWQKRYIKNIITNWLDKIWGESLSPHQFQNKLLNILLLGKLRLFLRTLIFGKNWCGDELDWNDCRITFKNNQGEIFYRYHHAFTMRELKNLFKKAGFKVEKCEIINGRNILMVGKK